MKNEICIYVLTFIIFLNFIQFSDVSEEQEQSDKGQFMFTFVATALSELTSPQKNQAYVQPEPARSVPA